MREDQMMREKEWGMDVMVQERRGMHADDMKGMTKLDATNNESYKYLRDHGNNYEYDPREMSPKWKNRHYRRFDTLNKNSDKMLHLADVVYWPQRMKVLCQANNEEMER